jgi:hypothetical protein
VHFELTLTKPVVSLAAIRNYDPELDNIGSILTDLCDALDGGARFSVSGFGQDAWPVDVRTDLLVFLEQLPEVLDAIHLGRAVTLDFYEQGLERSIDLNPSGSDYLLSCISSTSWEPSGGPECIDRAQLQYMLAAVRDQFLAYVGAAAPSLLNHPWMRGWLLPDHQCP